MSANMESVLERARQLPPAEQRQLAQKILADLPPEIIETDKEREIQAALAIVEQTRGTFAGLDRETLIRFAEDEEYCGY